MNKKFWTTLFALLMIASLALSACGGGQTQEPPAPVETEPAAAAETEPAAVEETEPVAAGDPLADVDPTGQTVTFWHQHTREREEALNQIVADFNASNEWGITVVPEYQGGYADIFNKMLGVLNTSDAPSLVVAYQNQAATYQLADGLVDLTPYVNSEKWGLSEEEQADFFQGFFIQDVFPTYGNARLGFPPNRSMEVLYYNADWLEELGFDGPPTTPAEFKEMACAAAATPFSRATAEGSIGYELSIDASRFASWTFAFGGDIFDYNTSQYTYDSEAAVEAMNFLQELFDEGCASVVVENYGDQTDFGAGKTLFTVGSSSGLPFYQTASDEGAQFNWSVAAIPHTTADPVMNIYGASVSIPVTTPEEQLAAWLFVKYYTSPEIQATWAEVSQYFPVRASVADELGPYFEANPAYKAAFDLLPYGKFEPPVPGYDFVRVAVGEAMAAIANGDDVASTLSSLDEESDAILDEQMDSPLPTPEPTEPPAAEEPAAPEVGTEDNPVKVLFVPSVDSAEIVAGGEQLAQVLEDATGLKFEVSVPTSYAATLEEMCASPSNTMGFIPGLGYVLANQLCGVDVVAKAVRFGYDWYAAMVVVPRDSEFQTVADLDGGTWAFPDPGSTSGYLYPLYMFQEAGVEPGETVEAGGHTGAIRAVYNGEVDFGTAFYSPMLMDGEAVVWEAGEEADVPADLIDSCGLDADGELVCGNYEVRDARRNLREEAPDVVQKVRVLATTPQIPNDTISFGPDFPQELRDAIMDALFNFAESDPEGFSTALAAYSWNGINSATDADYDPIRLAIQAAGFTLEDLGE